MTTTTKEKHDSKDLNTTTDPPPIKIATTHTFHRKSRLSSNLTIRSANIDRYTFKHTTSLSTPHITIHPGSSLTTPPLGNLTFNPTLSAFQIHFLDPTTSSLTSTNVKARAGHPHPKEFTFTPPSEISRGRTYTWRHREGWMRNPSRPTSSSFPVVYELVSGVMGDVHARLVVSRRKGDGTRVEWRREVGEEMELGFLVLSAVGVVVRLARGLDSRGQEGSGLFYWRLGPMFWFPGAGTVWS